MRCIHFEERVGVDWGTACEPFERLVRRIDATQQRFDPEGQFND